jgi:hypothetical protein
MFALLHHVPLCKEIIEGNEDKIRAALGKHLGSEARAGEERKLAVRRDSRQPGNPLLQQPELR